MERSAPFRIRPRSAFRAFIRSESAGGVVLMGAAGLALILANSPLAPAYFDALHADIVGMSLSHWINDGLMAVFFLLVGLEIKRELLDGQLSTWPRRALPGLAALGGMVVPALVYLAVNITTPDALRGWAIPAATDIAFALGVLSLLGSRVPVSLKVFLTALAILDDLGAVMIITLFYTSDLSPIALGGAISTLGVMAGLNHFRVTRLWPYLLLGGALWWFLLRSGVHPTLAGVLTALTIPLKLSPGAPEAADSPLHRLEHVLQPWVAFLIVPVFGLANTGVAFGQVAPAAMLGSVPLGVALGLFLGKQAGVFAFSWAAVRLRLAEVPAHATWLQIYGVSILCGVGFTMSLFIGLLAFPYEAERVELLKLGVLAGSCLSALAGALVLCLAHAKAKPRAEEDQG